MNSPELGKEGPRLGSRPFLNFAFFKLEKSWRGLRVEERRALAEEGLGIIKRHLERVLIRPYTTLGREECDFLLWLITDKLDYAQALVSELMKGSLGLHLTLAHSWISMVRESIYTGRHGVAFQEEPEPLDYLVVYPFVKSREWYLLPYEERKRMMMEHARVGRDFPDVRLNTTYSFGLDDQDFVLAFETNDLSRFQELVMRLRETEVSRYTIRDTPFIICRKVNLEGLFSSFI